MTNNPELFAYWLQGYIELGGERPSESQWEMIKEHLSLVFKKETRDLGDILADVKTHQEEPSSYPFKKLELQRVYC